MKLTRLLLGCLAFATACVESNDTGDDLTVEKTGMAGWEVPDGFIYEMSPTVSVSVSFGNGAARTASNEMIQYAIIGEDANEQVYGLHAGYADLSNGISINLSKPLHIESLYLYTKYQGNSKYFDISSGTISLSVSDLEVSDAFFETSTGRTASTPDCTSFLGSATQIRCRADGFSIKSSASISFIDVLYTNGQLQRTTPEEQSVNANDNQWFFPYTDFSASSIISFTVIADCRTSPRTISTELVTFVNPCKSEFIDTDNDGISDESDISPEDPQIASVKYIPAKSTYSTYAFEDMWPYLGDFDFNDLVIAHNAEVFTNAQDKVTKVTYEISIEAVGANQDNDLCLSFTDPGASVGFTIDSIETSGITYEVHKLQGETEIRFKHVKEGFSGGGYINTDSTRTYLQPVKMGMTLTFNGTVNLEDFEIDEFLRVDQEEGREIHKPGRAFTSLFDETWMQQASDDTKPGQKKYFLTENNLPWAIEIPTPWEYPKEKVEISKAYPNFVDYVQGKSNSPWYTDSDGNKIRKYLYKNKSK